MCRVQTRVLVLVCLVQKAEQQQDSPGTGGCSDAGGNAFIKKRQHEDEHSMERAPPIVPALAESPLEFIYCRPGTSGASQARADRPLRAFAQAPGQPDNGRMPL